MWHPIQDFRAKAAEVEHLDHYVPIDHEETALHWRVGTTIVVILLLQALCAWILGEVPKKHEGVLIVPIVLSVSIAWAMGYMVYVEYMHRLVKKFCPRSFTIPVSLAFF